MITSGKLAERMTDRLVISIHRNPENDVVVHTNQPVFETKSSGNGYYGVLPDADSSIVLRSITFTVVLAKNFHRK